MTQRSKRTESGAAAVEFALVSGVLFALVFATIQYGLYFWALQSGSQAAREAARQAAVGSPATLGCDEFESAVLDNVQGKGSDRLEATRTFYTDESLEDEGDPEIGGAVVVVVSFDGINLNLPFVPFFGENITERAVARVENVTDGFGACPGAVTP